jgi:hypothetical protein
LRGGLRPACRLATRTLETGGKGTPIKQRGGYRPLHLRTYEHLILAKTLANLAWRNVLARTYPFGDRAVTTWRSERHRRWIMRVLNRQFHSDR